MVSGSLGARSTTSNQVRPSCSGQFTNRPYEAETLRDNPAEIHGCCLVRAAREPPLRGSVGDKSYEEYAFDHVRGTTGGAGSLDLRHGCRYLAAGLQPRKA